MSIEEKAGIIKITPSENRGNDGFHGIALLALEIPADSPDLVPAIQIAFDRCR